MADEQNEEVFFAEGNVEIIYNRVTEELRFERIDSTILRVEEFTLGFFSWHWEEILNVFNQGHVTIIIKLRERRSDAEYTWFYNWHQENIRPYWIIKKIDTHIVNNCYIHIR